VQPAKAGFVLLLPRVHSLTEIGKSQGHDLRRLNVSERAAKGMVLYGALLIALGILAFALMGWRARTGLYAGIGVGALSALWGFLMARGVPWVLPVALGNVGFAALAFGWRAFIDGLEMFDGRPGHLAPALISTAMCAASAVMLSVLVRQWHEEEAAAGR
jgi:hypothetical protein